MMAHPVVGCTRDVGADPSSSTSTRTESGGAGAIRQAGGLGGEELLLADVRRAGGRGPELDDGGVGRAGLLEQVRAHRVQAVVVAEPLVEAVEQGEAGIRAVEHRGRRPPG